jgi:hypothetical protein
MHVELAKTDGISILCVLSGEIGVNELCQLINITAEEVPTMLGKIRDAKKRDLKLRSLCCSILNALVDEEVDEG